MMYAEKFILLAVCLLSLSSCHWTAYFSYNIKNNTDKNISLVTAHKFFPHNLDTQVLAPYQSKDVKTGVDLAFRLHPRRVLNSYIQEHRAISFLNTIEAYTSDSLKSVTDFKNIERWKYNGQDSSELNLEILKTDF